MEGGQQGGGARALEIWKRRKWLAILAALGVCTAVVSVTMFLPNVYQSTATILVERQQVPEAFVQTTVTSSIDIRLQTITQQVMSRSRLEGMINHFGLYLDQRQRIPLEQVLERMRQDIVIEQKALQQKVGKNEATVAFTISYRGSNPQQVAEVTNTLASYYIDENLKLREQQAAGTAIFLGAQLGEMRTKLEEQEQRLGHFKERYLGELPEQLPANIAVLERLNTQLRLNSEKRVRTSEQRAALIQQLAELEGRKAPSKLTTIVVTSDPQLNTPVTRHAQLQQELVKLSTRYGEKHPAIIKLQMEIAALENQPPETHSTKSNAQNLGQGTEALQNPYVQQLKKEFSILDVEMKGLQVEEKNLLDSITLYQSRVEYSPRREQELQILQRDYETAKGLYQSLLKRQEEARLAENLEQRQKGEQFRLLEPAVAAAKPAAPDRRKLLLMGVCLSLGFGVGVVILAEQRAPSFHTVEELYAFSQVPVLVSLPRIVTRANIRRRRWQSGLVALAVIVSLILIVGSSYVAVKGQVPLIGLYSQLLQLRK